MKKNDLFHIVLDFLYDMPLDGTYYDLRACVNGKLNKTDGERNAYAQFQKVIDFLQNKDYIVFEQRPARKEGANECHSVHVKYGQDPTGLGSEEANFQTTYPMAALTLAGSNYVRDRKKEKLKHGIYIATFVVALSSVTISLFNFLTNTKERSLQNKIEERDSLINQNERELKRALITISEQQQFIDSLVALKKPEK